GGDPAATAAADLGEEEAAVRRHRQQFGPGGRGRAEGVQGPVRADREALDLVSRHGEEEVAVGADRDIAVLAGAPGGREWRQGAIRPYREAADAFGGHRPAQFASRHEGEATV